MCSLDSRHCFVFMTDVANLSYIKVLQVVACITWLHTGFVYRSDRGKNHAEEEYPDQ